jgi:ABC-type Mn2+/Zn2+ transport system permease subunit
MGGVCAVTGSLAVAAASSRLRETREALTGWLFLAGSSLSVLIVANSPHGMAEVNRLLSSTIIGASDFDVAIFVTLLAVTVAVLTLRLRPLMLLLTDAQTAQALGIAVARCAMGSRPRGVAGPVGGMVDPRLRHDLHVRLPRAAGAHREEPGA